MLRLELKHPRLTRWFHWINVPLLAIMIWSGLLIYWANDVYRIGIGQFTLIKFFPEWFYEYLGLHHRLAEGMAWHFAVMWLLVINGACYVVHSVISGEWRNLVPTRRSFYEAYRVVLHDLHLSKIAPPQRKFNAAQQFAYTGVIIMGALSVVTGLAIYKPIQLAWLATLFGGYQTARMIHFWLTLGYVMFIVMHLTQVVRAGWNNFRAMVTGFELVPVEEKEGKNAK